MRPMPPARSRCSPVAALTGLTALWLSGCSPDYPKCDTDEHCKEGEFCVNGMCQQCRGDEDCPAGHSCASGACEAIPGYCTSAGDCGEGQDCQNNVCVTVAQAELPPPSTAGGCSIESVYFEYDSSTLDSGARDQLNNNASCIKEKDLKSVHLTGLTDPRGTEEYNMALGDRRAQSAQMYLKSLGVTADISYSSMGEEMATGQDEAGWARDRRVEIKER